MVYRQYTDADKAAYYARKANLIYGKRRSGAKSTTRYVKKKYSKKRRTSSGKYDYPGVGRMIGSGLGTMAGNLIAPGAGGMIGGALGGAVGHGAQALVKKITGFGDYHVSKNSLVYNVDAVPEFSSDNERCTIICHREYITDVISSTFFHAQTFRINPALFTTFPWLASVAQNYEQYVVQGMVFEFKTTSATAVASTNTSLGTVVMATQYNSLAPSFSNKQQMENYEFSQSSVPSQSILHPIECDPMQTQCGGIFNMYDANDASGDTRLYDIGKFTIATVGMQSANANIGELWVSYKICLLKPRLQSISDVADWYLLDPGTVSPIQPLGDISLVQASPYNSGIIEFTGTNQMYIDPTFVGVLQVCVYYQGSTLTSVLTPYIQAIAGNCSVVSSEYTNFTASNVGTLIADSAGSNRYCPVVGYVRVTGGLTSSGVKPTIAVGGMSTTAFTCSRATLSVLSVPDNFLVDPFP